MIPMWFMSFGSDIYVFICMGFVLCIYLMSRFVVFTIMATYVVKIWEFWLFNVK